MLVCLRTFISCAAALEVEFGLLQHQGAVSDNLVGKKSRYLLTFPELLRNSELIYFLFIIVMYSTSFSCSVALFSIVHILKYRAELCEFNWI